MNAHRLDRIATVCLVVLSCLVVATLPLGAVANAPEDAAKRTPRHVVRQVDHRLDVLRSRVLALERVASSFRVWLHCIRPVPVAEIGARDHDFGFLYDQVDGTGIHHRRGLVRYEGPGRAPFVLLAFARRPACWSAPVTPNGTGADAKSGSTAPPSKARVPLPRAVRKLERRVVRLGARIVVLERVARRFDEWESCLSAVAVTEQGDPGRRFGYHYKDAGGQAYRHALDLDSSEWDDPDYQLLAFIGRDRPFQRRECSRDPGEAPDKSATVRLRPGTTGKAPSRREVLDDLAQVVVDSRELVEDIPDLREALDEFTSFDQCMFTVGVSYSGAADGQTGYLFEGPYGNVVARPAMGLALDGATRVRWDFLAFPGEEPPQIECNEDAGGQDTEE